MRRPRRRRRHDRGFTLLEIMIVLALLGLIAGTIGTAVYRRWNEGQLRSAKLQVRELLGVAQETMLDDPACPTIDDMVAKGSLRKLPKDPWGTPLTLVCPPTHGGKDPVEVTSAGPDKKLGSGDDINSWTL
jgi:general secretion pathway protein G